MEILKQFLLKSEAKKLKIAVIGDSMVDEYYAVRINRVSPEFPIPVLLSETDKPISAVPGGAANVCHQMKNWNVDAYLLSVFDDINPVFDHINCDYSVMVNQWKLPRKKRFYDGDFPLDRWDIELKVEKTLTSEWSEARKRLLKNFEKMLREVHPDIVILSDYYKGVFLANQDNISNLIIKICKDRDIHVVVDPKSVDMAMWSECSILKPNASWAKTFCEKYDTYFPGDDTWNRELTFIQDKMKCESIVLTDSGNGIGTFSGNKTEFLDYNTLSKKRPHIRSVIGAGDCFLAFFAMAYALDFTVQQSARIAFNGASAYIEDKHNNPVSIYQFHKWFDPIAAKIVSPLQLTTIKNQLPKQTWVLSNGCFDAGLTMGHIECLKFAKNQGDKLIIAINGDNSVRRLKGESRPIFPLKDRMAIMASLEFVDFVTFFDQDTPLQLIEQLNVNKVVKGGDYKAEEVAGYGLTEIVICPFYDYISTTEKINLIKDFNEKTRHLYDSK